MSKYAKYQFEETFERSGVPGLAPLDEPDDELSAEAEEPVEEIEVVPTFSEEEVQQAREVGYAEGLATGADQTGNAIEAQTAAALTRIAEQMTDLTAGLENIRGQSRREATELALAVARKLAPALIEREPVAEIEAMVTKCLEEHTLDQHMTVRVAEDLAEPVRARLQAKAEELDLAERLKTIGDPDLKGADCRIEWDQGGAERKLEDLVSTIETAVGKYLNAEFSGADDKPQPDDAGPVESSAEAEAEAEETFDDSGDDSGPEEKTDEDAAAGPEEQVDTGAEANEPAAEQ